MITPSQQNDFVNWFNKEIELSDTRSFLRLSFRGVSVFCSGESHTKCLEYLETIGSLYSYDLN